MFTILFCVFQVDNINNVQENRGIKRKLSSRKNSSEERVSACIEKRIATRSSSRHPVKQSKCEDDNVSNCTETPQKLRTCKSKVYQLRKSRESNTSVLADDDIQIINASEESLNKNKEVPRKSASENDKNAKVYSLRHSSQASKKQETVNAAVDTGNLILISKIHI